MITFFLRQQVLFTKKSEDFLLNHFHVIILGLADPGPIASIFWLDEELGSDIYLDGIVTVVDAKYGLEHLKDPERKMQNVIEDDDSTPNCCWNTAINQIAL